MVFAFCLYADVMTSESDLVYSSSAELQCEVFKETQSFVRVN